MNDPKTKFLSGWLGKRFSIRTMMIFVTLSSMAAALIAQPLYRYQIEQRVIKQIGAVTLNANPAVLSIS